MLPILLTLTLMTSFTSTAFAAEKYAFPEKVIYANKEYYVKLCNQLGWELLSKTGFVCAYYGKGVKVKRKKMTATGDITKIKGNFLTGNSYVLTKDLENGSKAPASIACRWATDAMKIDDALSEGRLTAVIAILENEQCKSVGYGFFRAPVVDTVKNYDSYVPRLEARYHNGQEWWTIY